jgi:hypothetical protein
VRGAVGLLNVVEELRKNGYFLGDNRPHANAEFLFLKQLAQRFAVDEIDRRGAPPAGS